LSNDSNRCDSVSISVEEQVSVRLRGARVCIGKINGVGLSEKQGGSCRCGGFILCVVNKRDFLQICVVLLCFVLLLLLCRWRREVR
jgi:hypothetical protein